MRFDGQVAFITGASSGIGEAIARRLAREGARVAVASSGNIGKSECVAASIRAAGGEAWPCAVDVRRRHDVAACLEAAASELGQIGIIVNSAGVYYPTPLGATPEADVDRLLDVNIKGTFNVIDAAAPGLKARASGKIINIASVAAVFGIRGFSLYCASKAAVAQMTVALARELAPFNINCNAIAPGNTSTPMNEEFRTSARFEAERAAVAAITPSTRAFSAPADIAAVAAFLASDDARAFHGALLVADEGISTGVG